MARRKGCRRGCGCLLVLLILAAVVVAFTEPGKAVRDLWSTGAAQSYLKPAPQRQAAADHEAALKDLHAAIMAYHDSEGAFPPADDWMDAITPRLRVNDMASEEAAKRLVRPDLRATPGAYGYAFNRKAAGKYADDAGPKDTVLLFETGLTGPNAIGDPSVDKTGLGITIGGDIVR